jgi:NhaP-type Na+/H+ or K+/H+ antiporter
MIIETIKRLITDIFSLLLVVGGGILIGLLIYIGIQYTRSGPEKASELKKWLIFVLTGLIIVFLAEFIPVLIRSFFE